MILDQPTVTRNARSCIGITPVSARHRGRLLQVRSNSTQDITQLLDAATRDNMMIIVVAVKADFGDKMPKSMDDFELFIQKRWYRFQVTSVPDFFDDISPVFNINLQSTEKGIE